jgi:hypothetical protein
VGVLHMAINIGSIIAVVGSIGKIIDIIKSIAKIIKEAIYKSKKKKIDEAETAEDFEDLLN